MSRRRFVERCLAPAAILVATLAMSACASDVREEGRGGADSSGMTSGEGGREPSACSRISSKGECCSSACFWLEPSDSGFEGRCFAEEERCPLIACAHDESCFMRDGRAMESDCSAPTTESGWRFGVCVAECPPELGPEESCKPAG